jgi:hypothetical protein
VPPPQTLATAELIRLATVSRSTRSSPRAPPQGEEPAGAFCCRRRVPHHCNGVAGVRAAAVVCPAVLGTVIAAPAPVPPSQLASPHRQLRPGAFRAMSRPPARFGVSPAWSAAGHHRISPPERYRLSWVAAGRPSSDLRFRSNRPESNQSRAGQPSLCSAVLQFSPCVFRFLKPVLAP